MTSSPPVSPTPAPPRRRRRTPSITGVFTAAFVAIAIALVADRLDEEQPDGFGMIARWVNRMAGALAWSERVQEGMARLLTVLNSPPGGGERGADAGGFGPPREVLAAVTGAPALALYQPHYDTNEWAATAVRRATAHPLSRDVVRQLVGEAGNVIHHAGAAADPVRQQLAITSATTIADASGGLALVPLRSRGRLVGLLVVLLATDLPADARTALEQAAPNLAIACERETAHQHTRRLAIEVRHAAQRLESQNVALTTLNDKLEEQHRELSRLNLELDQAGKRSEEHTSELQSRQYLVCRLLLE